MKLTHLAALRQSSPGSPSLSDVARRIKVSRQAVNQFEVGRAAMSAEKVQMYARTIGATVDLVWRMFYLTALRFHRERIAEITEQLKGRPGKAARSRELQTA